MSDDKVQIITSMNYSNTDNILSDMKNIIEAAQQQAYQAVNINSRGFMKNFQTFWTH